jgi:hypothetical protein
MTLPSSATIVIIFFAGIAWIRRSRIIWLAAAFIGQRPFVAMIAGQQTENSVKLHQ